MKKQFGLLIDTKRCVGCRTCMVACKMENRVPEDVFRMKVFNQEGSIIDDRPTGNNQLSWQPEPCMHCHNPACIKACPVNAIIKRDDGIVYINKDLCNGCEQCTAACPYGAPLFMTEYKKADKCDLCMHRIDVGKLPICVECCPARAIEFGNVDDPYSSLSKKIKIKKAKVLNPEEKTEPSVFYIS